MALKSNCFTLEWRMNFGGVTYFFEIVSAFDVCQNLMLSLERHNTNTNETNCMTKSMYCTHIKCKIEYNFIKSMHLIDNTIFFAWKTLSCWCKQNIDVCMMIWQFDATTDLLSCIQIRSRLFGWTRTVYVLAGSCGSSTHAYMHRVHTHHEAVQKQRRAKFNSSYWIHTRFYRIFFLL